MTGALVANLVVPAFALPSRAGAAELPSGDWNFNEKVSRSSAGAEGNGISDHARITKDGRFVVFESNASTLVDGAGYEWQVYLHDRQTGSTELISKGLDGQVANAFSTWPSVSDDGRYVVYQSKATNLVQETAGQNPDGFDAFDRVYLFDRVTQSTRLVSVAPTGAPADYFSQVPVISGDGQWVAFASEASNLAQDSVQYQWRLYLHNVQSGMTEMVRNGGESMDVDALEPPSIAENGQYVAFRSRASWNADDLNETDDIYRYDRSTQSVSLVSRAESGKAGNGLSSSASISADGGRVAFVSESSDLVADDTNGVSDVFVWDQNSPNLMRVSVTENGEQADGRSLMPSLSPNGDKVAFASHAFNLLAAEIPVDANRMPDPSLVYVHNLTSHSVQLASQPYQGMLSGEETNPALSDSGALAFRGDSENLAPFTDPNTNYSYGSLYVAQNASTLPSWPVGSKLTGEATASGVTLQWPALPGQDVIGYKVYRTNTHKELLGATDGSTTSFTVSNRTEEELQDGFQVEAVSHSYQTSWGSGPMLVKGWNDHQAPTWPESPMLEYSTYEGYISIFVTPQAADNVAVAGYRLYSVNPTTKAETVLKDSPWSGFEFESGDLLPDTEYTVLAKAYDAAGNESEPTPTKVFRTPAGIVKQTGTLSKSDISGGFHLSWTPGDNTISSYEVWDVTPGTNPSMLKDGISATSPQYDVTHLPPGSYTFVVRGRNASRQVAYETNTVTVTVAGAKLLLAVDRTGMSGSTLAPGASQAVTVTGLPNSSVTVTVNYDKWDTSNKPYVKTHETMSVPMTESSTQGVYKGTLKLAENTATITSISASQADPNGGDPATASVQGLPWQVWGSWEATVTVPAELTRPLQYRVVLSSKSTGVSQTKVLNDSGTLSFVRLPEASDYQWQLFDSFGHKIMESTNAVSIYGGLKQLESLDVKVTTIQVKVTEDDNTTPIANAAVTLFNADNGRYVGQVTTDANGVTRLYTLTDRQVQNLQVRLLVDENVYQRPEPQSFALNLEQLNQKTIAVHKLQKGKLQGHVVSNGKPINEAVVSVSGNVQGRFYSEQVKTDRDGFYSFDLFAGDATVNVVLPSQFEYGSESRNVKVEGNSTTTADFSIAALQVANLKIKLYTKYSSDTEWQGPLPIDWTVGIHMHVTVNGAGVSSDSVVLRGQKPGDKVNVCIDGTEGNLSKVCVDAPIGEDMNAVAEIRLQENSTDIFGSLRLPAAAGALRMWSGALYDQNNNMLDYLFGNSSAFRFKPKTEGPMKLVFNAEGNVYGATYQKSVNVNLIKGTPQNLGTLDLTRSGVFATQEGNSLQTSTPQLRPGQNGTLRAAYKATRDVSNAKLTFRIPDGTDAVANSVVINEVTATADQVDLVSKPGFAIVKLGNVTKGQAGVVRISFQVQDNYRGTELLSDATISFDGSNGEEVLGQVKISTSLISLTAPLRTNALTWTVTGTGPINGEVSVYEGQQLLGKTTAGAGGVWAMSLTLPDPKGDKLFHLQAVSTDGDGNAIRSKVTDVSYEPNEPVLQEMTMRQGDSRIVTLDLTKGVPRFPYVVRPWDGFYFDLKFNDPTKVENVKVHLGHGANETVGIAKLGDDNLWHVEMSGVSSVGEGIYVTFDRKKAPPVPITQVPTEAQARDRMPAGMRDVTIDSKEMLHTTGNVTTGHVDLTLPDSQMGLGVDVSMEENLTYTPTVEEQQKAAATGIPVYGLSFDVKEEDGKQVSYLSGYVQKPNTNLSVNAGLNLLVSALNNTSSQTTISPQYSAAGGNIVNAVKVTGKIVWNEKDALYKGGNDIQQTKQNIDGRFDVEKKFDQVVDLAVRANSCPGGQVWNSSIEMTNNLIIAGEVTKWALNLAGAVLAPETLGASLVFNIAGNLLQSGVDMVVDARLKSLNDHISQMGDCAKPKDDSNNENGGSQPTASPVWIYDPSGFVYETFEDNPVADVKATVYYLDAQSNQWIPWDAEWYEQINPQLTDPEGKYGWDVPNGTWKVVYEKDGYDVSESAAMDVPPPRFNVNTPMISNLPPQLTVHPAQSSNSGTTLEITTDKYVRTDSLTTNSVTLTVDGTPVTGTLTAGGARTDSNNVSLARTFTFTTTQKLTVGKQVLVTLLASDIVSYAGIASEPDADLDTVTQTVPVQAADTQAPTLSTAVLGANGDVVTLMFNEALNTKKALAGSSFTLQGSTVTPQSVEYGVDGQSVKLFLNGKVATSGVKVNVVAGGVEDASHNGSGALTAALTDNSVSSDATLKTLLVAGGSYPMTPTFSPNITSYKISVPDNLTTTTIRAVPTNNGATLRLDGYVLTANLDREIALQKTGETVIPLGVTAGDGTTTRQYELRISHGYVPPVYNGGGSTSNTSNGTLTLNDVKKLLRDSALTMDLASAKAPLSLQADALAYLKDQGAKIVLKQTEGTITLPANVFGDQIEKQVGALDSKITLTFNWNAITGDTASKWFKQAQQRDASYHAASSALQLTVTATSGSKTSTLNPMGALEVQLAIPQVVDSRKAGVYEYDATTETWTYLRATLDKQTNVLTARVSGGQPLALFLYDKTFTDTTGHWAQSSIERLAAHHIIAGKTETEFGPESSINRAEFVSLIDRLLNLPNPIKQTTFSDVANGDWYEGSVSRAAGLGIVHGREDNRFAPEGLITREEMVVMIANALQFDGKIAVISPEEQAKLLAPFADANDISDWARSSFAQAIKLGLVSGVSPDELAPGDLLTRAQAAVILDRYPQTTL
nr:S-layer homology domain-containing protein [Tumebacillus amylolyticus]